MAPMLRVQIPTRQTGCALRQGARQGRQLGQRIRLRALSNGDPTPEKKLNGKGPATINDGAIHVPSKEKFWDIDEVLREARAAGGDALVFTDDSDEAVWQHEARIQRAPYEPEELAQEDMYEMPAFPVPELPEQQPSAYSDEAGFTEISVAELRDRRMGAGTGQSPLFLLDVRGRDEYDEARVPGAVLIPLDELSAAVKAGELDAFRSSPFAIICRSGRRSAQACVRLSKVFGFTSPINVAGGTLAWIDAGHEVERGAP